MYCADTCSGSFKHANWPRVCSLINLFCLTFVKSVVQLWATWATGPGKDGATSDSVAREANADVAYKLGQAFRITIGLPPSEGHTQPADVCPDRLMELRLRAGAAFRFGFSTLFMLQVMSVTFLRDIDALKMEAGVKDASELPEEAREEAGHGISAYVR